MTVVRQADFRIDEHSFSGPQFTSLLSDDIFNIPASKSRPDNNTYGVIGDALLAHLRGDNRFPPIWEPGPLDRPSPAERGGRLSVEGDAVKTSGGYEIKQLGQFEWSITGPDGKSTRVWGDPHVEEGDGGKFDFKRDTTFVLGDGTEVHVKTAPYGNGATVTAELEIISGNNRVVVSGIDAGKGQIGTVTQDGKSRTNSFGGYDVFTQGRETDDWAYQGREILGSINGGDSFTLGGELEYPNQIGDDDSIWEPFPQNSFPAPRQKQIQMMMHVMQQMFELLQSMMGGGGYSGNSSVGWSQGGGYDPFPPLYLKQPQRA